ncbi:citrate lyase subunit alpha, partial [Vibrio sp. 16]
TEVAQRLEKEGVPLVTIDQLQQRAQLLTGEPRPIRYTDKVVGIVRYRDGSVIDVIKQVKE